jgi:hypothetical protein
MINFFVGLFLGFFVATYGVAGVAEAVDKGVDLVKHVNIKVEK